jgi:hypothetical protein
MPLRRHEDTTISVFITICLLSFLFAVLSTDHYYKYKNTKPAIADRSHKELTISWIIFTISGSLAICTHNMYSKKRANFRRHSISVPV